MAAPLFGLLGSTPSAPSAVPLDQGTQNVINNETAQAGQDVSQYANQLNQNTGNASGLLGNSQSQKQAEAAQGGMSPGMFGAIRNVYANQAGSSIANLNRQNQMQATMQKADYMNQTAQALLGQQAALTNQYQVLTNAYNQSEAARAGTIASLTQVANFGIAHNAANASKGTQSSGLATSQGPVNASNIDQLALEQNIS